MLGSLRVFPAQAARSYSQLAAATATAGATRNWIGASNSTTAPAPIQVTNVQHPYFIPRNANERLPVYSDIRNGGTRYLVLIRNVEGNVDRLVKDLADSLFEQGSPEAARMRIMINNSRHLVIQGGRWKTRVTEWLMAKGF